MMCEQNESINKGIEILKRNEKEITELKGIITEMRKKIHQRYSKTDLSRQKKETVYLKINQCILSNLRKRIKKFEKKES